MRERRTPKKKKKAQGWNIVTSRGYCCLSHGVGGRQGETGSSAMEARLWGELSWDTLHPNPQTPSCLPQFPQLLSARCLPAFNLMMWLRFILSISPLEPSQMWVPDLIFCYLRDASICYLSICSFVQYMLNKLTHLKQNNGYCRYFSEAYRRVSS